MSFEGVYPHYIINAERKGRTKEEVDIIIFWLTGYDLPTLQDQICSMKDFKNFFLEARKLNPNAVKITVVICGYRIEEIEVELMK